MNCSRQSTSGLRSSRRIVRPHEPTPDGACGRLPERRAHRRDPGPPSGRHGSRGSGAARVDAEGTKGPREARVELHLAVVDHLRAIVKFAPLVFACANHKRTLWPDFATLKATAKVEFPERSTACGLGSLVPTSTTWTPTCYNGPCATDWGRPQSRTLPWPSG